MLYGFPNHPLIATQPIVPEDLDGFTLEQRHTLYRMMRLKVLVAPDGKAPNLTADWGCNASSTPRSSSIFTTHALRFRAVLTEDGGKEVELSKP